MDQPSDSRSRKSQIKPRISIAVEDPAPKSSSDVASTSTVPPPPTSIRHLQQVGSRFCGIPPEEIADDHLLVNGTSPLMKMVMLSKMLRPLINVSLVSFISITSRCFSSVWCLDSFFPPF